MKPILPFFKTASKRVIRSEVPRQGGHRYHTRKTLSKSTLFPGLFPLKNGGGGSGKGPGIGRSHDKITRRNCGCNKLAWTDKFNMAAMNGETKGKPPDYLEVLRLVKTALDSGQFPHFNLKPLQVKCLEYIFKGQDIVAVLPTGFGKSLKMFHLLPYFLPVEKTRNIVIVMFPLNAIIEDQLKVLTSRKIA